MEKFKFIGAPSDAERLQKNQQAVLTGRAAFVKLYKKGEVAKDYDGYLRQTKIALRGTKNSMVSYINKSVAANLGNKQVLISTYALMKYFTSEVLRRKIKEPVIFLYVYKLFDIDGRCREINVEHFAFKNGKLEVLSESLGLSEGLFQQHFMKKLDDSRTGDYVDSQVFVYSAEPLKFNIEASYVTVKGNEPFELSTNVLKKTSDEWFGRFVTDSIIGGEKKGTVIPIKEVFLPVSLSVICVAGLFGYAEMKESEFKSLQKKYHAFEQQVDGLPDQGLLKQWDDRRLFWNEMASKPNPVIVQRDVIGSLSMVSKSDPSLGLNLERMEVKMTTPLIVQEQEFNVELELAVLPSIYDTPEEQASRVASMFTQALGTKLKGHLDVWDDIVSRTINGKRFNIVKIYFNHIESNKAQKGEQL